MSSASAQADVFTAVEIARAAAIDVRDVRAMRLNRARAHD